MLEALDSENLFLIPLDNPRRRHRHQTSSPTFCARRSRTSSDSLHRPSCPDRKSAEYCLTPRARGCAQNTASTIRFPVSSASCLASTSGFFVHFTSSALG